VELRPPTAEDAPSVLEVVLARDVLDVGEPDYTLEDLDEEWAAGDFDLARDAVVADEAGRVVGYAAMRPGEAHAYVHPDAEGRGIGSALLDWTERRAAERGHDRFRQDVGARNARAAALLRARGYERVRSYWRMVVDSDAVAAEAPPVPSGMTARALDPLADAEPLYAINERAFAAVASYRGEPLERFREQHLGAKTLDPDLSVVVEADGRAVGFALCRRWADEGRGYVDLLAVDPDAAGRGLGSWLLAAVFARCRAAGLRQAMLGVAGDNPRAMALYERAGMRIHFQVDSYERAPEG
jgi:mycothiol synthase